MMPLKGCVVSKEQSIENRSWEVIVQISHVYTESCSNKTQLQPMNLIITELSLDED